MMGDDDLGDLFNEFFKGSPELPPPTEDERRLEAMTATELHIVAFTEATERGGDGYHEMLPSWLDELKHYLPILEEFEEYEQCQKVFDTMRAIREDHSNVLLNHSLRNLRIDGEAEVLGDQDEPDSDELDF